MGNWSSFDWNTLKCDVSYKQQSRDLEGGWTSCMTMWDWLGGRAHVWTREEWHHDVFTASYLLRFQGSEQTIQNIPVGEKINGNFCHKVMNFCPKLTSSNFLGVLKKLMYIVC